jgi:hypothetical protein
MPPVVDPVNKVDISILSLDATGGHPQSAPKFGWAKLPEIAADAKSAETAKCFSFFMFSFLWLKN